MKKLLLIGNGEAHAEVLRQLSINPAANADIVLASASSQVVCAAMLPAHVAGHHAREQCIIDLAPLARKAGVRVVTDRVIVFDPGSRVAVTAGGQELPFDFASINVPGTSLDPAVPGLARFALLARPADVFLEGWERVRELAAEGALSRLTVVGGEAEGVELMLAIHHNLRLCLPAPVFAACGFSIVTAAGRLLATLPPALGRVAEAECLARGISLLRGAAVVEVERASLRLSNGAQLASDITVWAAGAHGPRWLGAAAGLECDARARVKVDAHMRSLGNKRVYVTGPAAVSEAADAEDGQDIGVGATAQEGEGLAANLRQALAGEPPAPVPAGPVPLTVVTLGSRRAVAARGAQMLAAPAWLSWRFKDWRDRRYLRRFLVAARGAG